MSKAEKLLRELIALPSVNPAFLPAGDARAGESRVADFLAATAAQAGLEVEFHTVLPGRANVIARLLPSGRTRRRIVLAPHLDTVGANGDEAFVARLKNGRLYGRGACDTKGSVAAMLSAVTELANGDSRPRETEIVFAGLVDEEVGQAGSRQLVADGFKADLAIVGEPTRLQVVSAHKGNLWLLLETRGKAAHGSRPDLGRNAVHAMAKVVEALETRYSAQLRRKRHHLLGRGSVNVGAIRGGSQPNIVPDHCVIQVDRRTLPGETESSVRREIDALLRQRHLRAKVSSIKTGDCPPMETDSTLPLVRRFLNCAGQRHPKGVDFFCDAAVLAQGGIPSVVFGPGDIAQAHTPDEWVSLRALERAREMLVCFLESLS